jgi:hypothetical protein
VTPSRGGDQPESLRADALLIPSVGDLVADIPCLIVALGRVPRRHRISDEDPSQKDAQGDPRTYRARDVRWPPSESSAGSSWSRQSGPIGG